MVAIIKHDGRWCPEGAQKAWNRYAGRAPDMQTALNLCKQKRVVVQAGGNIGAWPVWLSKRFKEVITFEPELVNYQCLIKNVEPYKNIEPYNAALGEHEGHCEINVCRSIGSHHVKKTGEGATRMMTIDGFKLDVLDLIVLDIEGFEWEALSGARETLTRCRPVIQLEDRNHGVTKGTGKTLTDILRLLPDYGIIARVGRDIILQPQGA